MSKDVVVAQGAIIEVPETVTGKGAWKVAQYIADAEGDVRLAKGRFWNACEHGTREEICDSFGWSYSGMARYAMFATETFAIAKISFSHWNNLVAAGVKKDERPAVLQEAADKGWTPKELTENLMTDKPKPTPKPKKTNSL